MPTSRVDRNHRVTIPMEVREKAGITRGESVTIEYDDEERSIRITSTKRGKRKRWTLGSKITVEEVEAAIQRGRSGS